jgi:hypothetical protein
MPHFCSLFEVYTSRDSLVASSVSRLRVAHPDFSFRHWQEHTSLCHHFSLAVWAVFQDDSGGAVKLVTHIRKEQMLNRGAKPPLLHMHVVVIS